MPDTSCIHARIFDLLEAVARHQTRAEGVRVDRIVTASGYPKRTVERDVVRLTEVRLLVIEPGQTPTGGGPPPNTYRLGPAAFHLWRAIQRVMEERTG